MDLLTCRHRESLLSAILDGTHDGVLVVGEDMRVKLANRRVGEMLAQPEPSLIGRVCSDVLGSASCGENCPVRLARDRRRPVDGHITWLHPGGAAEPRVARVSVRPLLTTEGQRLGCLVTLSELPAEDLRGQEFAGLVAQSPAMGQVFARIRQLSESTATVLLTGESGTGKELVARALHQTGQRREGPFVAVNCASLPATLLESELFGHVRGAFTGAVRDRAGRVASAGGGTLFLDEIGDLPLELQPKLLRLLQEHQYESLGDDRTKRVDIRVVAATNADLPRLVASGRFREDLYYRLRVIPIHLPPLRERQGDIPLLAGTLLRRRSQAAQRDGLRLSTDALRTLEAFAWPGNVRQLLNAIDYVVALAAGPLVEAADLPPEVQRPERVPQGPTSLAPIPAPRRYERRPGAAEEDSIRHALQQHDWHRGRAARELGMDRITLYRRMRRYGITAPSGPS